MKKIIALLALGFLMTAAYSQGLSSNSINVSGIYSNPSGDNLEDFDGSFGISAAYDHSLAENLFLEAELAYRFKYEYEESDTMYGVSYSLTGEYSVLSVMAYAKYVIPASDTISPFIRAGLGWRKDKLEVSADASYMGYSASESSDSDESGLALAIGGGVSITAGNGSVDIGVTYNHGTSDELKDSDIIDITAGYTFKI
ncbi:MAG: porin family protein [Candidatus Aureabacteria bacterium]|nr:porin family protein [Candidatus Auribacterota bacterium]